MSKMLGSNKLETNRHVKQAFTRYAAQTAKLLTYYTSQSGRSFKIRMNKHKKKTKRNDLGFSQYCINNGHTILDNCCKINKGKATSLLEYFVKYFIALFVLLITG